MVIEQLDNSIKSAKSILLVSHINPDGDTLGSMSAMYSLIYDNYKKKADMVAVSEIPVTYRFLPDTDKVKHISQIDLSREYDLVINLDIASPDRCIDAQILLNKAKNSINIDHHKTNSDYAKINIVEPDASATAEVLYGIAKFLKWKISHNAALGLYVGILTDTGSFRFSNTTQRTMEYAGELISTGINPSEIYQKCYESNSKEMTLFQSYCIGKAVFTEDDTIAYTVVYKKDLEKFKNNGEDFTEGLTEKLRAVKNVEIAFVAKETSASTTKISMRSKTADIAKICSNLGGGGHIHAAGTVINAPVEQAVKLVLKEIKKK